MLTQKKTFRVPELKLQSGSVLRDVEVGYETHGTLNSDGSNAVLICHFFSGTSHCAGRYQETDPEPGYWDAIIGPGKAIDTDRYFVISSDVLSNVNAKAPHVVSTGPASLNPSTGRVYGSQFPIVTIGDFVRVQHLLVQSLGVHHLHMVAGPSMGALQSLEWSAQFPSFVSRVMPVIGAGLSFEPYQISQLQQWCDPILMDPAFQNGDYYGTGLEPLAGLTHSLKLITFTALHPEWARRLFERRWADERDPLHELGAGFAVDRALNETAATRARFCDANALLRIARANQLFSIEDRLSALRARFLFIPASSDLLMTPAMIDRSIARLRSLGLSVDTFTIEGTGGHLDGLNAIAQASDAIRKFVNS